MGLPGLLRKKYFILVNLISQYQFHSADAADLGHHIPRVKKS